MSHVLPMEHGWKLLVEEEHAECNATLGGTADAPYLPKPDLTFALGKFSDISRC